MADIISIFTEKRFMGNELWRWGALFGLLLGSLVAGKMISFVLHHQARRLARAGKARPLSTFLESLAGPSGLLLLAGGLYLAGYLLRMERVHLQGQGAQKTEVVRLVTMLEVPVWVKVCQTLAVLAIGWFTFKLVDIVEMVLKKWTARTQTSLDDQLVPLIRKTLRVFVVIVAILFVVQNVFGQQIGPLIAGLGIGGLAVALAAKDALSNLFGSVTIFTDRPFQMGDRIKVGGHDGIVEEVGFRSTRIRTLMGHQVVVPNSVMSNEAVENIGRRPYLKRVMEIAVTYDTPPEKLQRGVEILNDMLRDRSASFPEDLPPRVYFNDFGASSLDIVVYYWFTPPDWWEYMQFNHEFNMELLERFNAEGIEFAFPTQTLHIKRS